MSTAYYPLRDPITSIKVEEGPSHDRVSIWESGGLAGVLTVSKGAGSRIAFMLADTTDEVLRTGWGGDSIGCVVYGRLKTLAPDLCVVSEYGEVMTVSEVAAMAGNGKR